MSSKVKKIDSTPKKRIKKEFYIPRNSYRKSYVNPLWARNNNSAPSAVSYTKATIETLMRNPYVNYKKLQEISNYFWRTSPFYQNIIYYLGTLLTFDGVLTPNSISEGTNADTLKKRLLSSALAIKNIDARCRFPSMMIRTLLNGETYWYDLSTEKDGVTLIEEIPSKYCRLAYIDDVTGVWRYYVDLSLLESTTLYELPQEIINAYNRYHKLEKADQKKKSLNIDLNMEVPNYLHLVGENGFCMFVHKEKSQHDYPFLASMFKDINSLEYNKDYMDDYLKESNIKLIHLKIPTDKETGEPLLEEPDIRAYHESAKEHLPSSTAPLTNPFDVVALNFDRVQDSAMNITKNSKDMAQFGSGVSPTLFEANTTNGLGYSVEADASKMYPLLSFFTDLVNSKIKKDKFSVTFLQIHRHNRVDWHTQYATDLLNGGHRSLFMATNGIDLYDSIMIAQMEQLLGFDDWLPPKLNASQGSVEDLDSLNGRPSSSEGDKADSTVTGDNYK